MMSNLHKWTENRLRRRSALCSAGMTFTVPIPSHSNEVIPIPVHSRENTLFHFPFSPDTTIHDSYVHSIKMYFLK